MWVFLRLEPPDFACSHKAFIQFPRAKRLLLMFAPSTNLIPLLFVLLALSDPARSIRLNFAIFISALIPWALSLCSTVIYKTAWDLEEASLASVLSFVLALLPYTIYLTISSVFVVMISITFATNTPFTASSLNSN